MKQKPEPPPAEVNALLALYNSHRYAEAESSTCALLARYPEIGYFWKLLSVAQHMQGKNPLLALQKAAHLLPGDFGVHNNLGTALHDIGQLENAAASFRHAVKIKPDLTMAHFNLAIVLRDIGQLDAAAASFRNALHLEPGSVELHNNLGNVLSELGCLDDAAACYRKALVIEPNNIETHNNLGLVQYRLAQFDAAATSFRYAVGINPNFALAHFNLGTTLNYLGMHDEAVHSYNKALEIQPEHAHARYNLGNILWDAQKYEEAMTHFKKLLSVSPDYPFALGRYLFCKMSCCDWSNIDEEFNELLAGVDAGKAVSNPFTLLAIPSNKEQQKKCSKTYILAKLPVSVPLADVGNRHSHNKIRIGYFSSDFYNHATAYLMAELLELHDRSKFEIFGFSFGAPSNDYMSQRIRSAFDRFMEVKNESDQAIAALARSLEIDIAVDLKGLTQGLRTGIFALRAAPIQVNYLGYPGTMGASFIDYIIADPVIIPNAHQRYYIEKVVYLPNSYQVNDSHRQIAEHQFTRNEAGLPAQGFVFCCFNNNYKITSDVFDIWMQLLSQVKESVLWLFEDNTLAKQNLQNEAVKRGIIPERIVFAKRMNLPDHLARHRLADLFLDSFYCNAHTTASDTLWAGLPLLTCLGDTFASRVAASLLHAIGLPELVTHSHAEYQARALELALNPEKLAAIKAQLAKNRATHPLFNTPLYVQHIEDAFAQMWQRHQKSLLPDHIYVRKENE